jgi:predicted Zn-dependent peptidase
MSRLMKGSSVVSLAVLPLVIAACEAKPAPMAPPPPPVPSASVSAVAPPPPPDRLGPKPEVVKGAAYVPPVAESLKGPGGSTIWLVERHELPLVSVAVVTPHGGSRDPADEAGLAHLTADLLDEGGGKRDALAFAGALDAIGARIASSGDRDSSVVSLEVLSAKLPEALELLGDAVVRPRHDEKDFKRVFGLWQNALKSRGDDPNDVARVATSAAFFGADHPYGRPLEGTSTSSAHVTRAKVKAFHRAIWRPDAVTFVVVGDVKKDAVVGLLDKAFSGWKAPKDALPEPLAPAPKAVSGLRTVVVPREGAPQVVMSIARLGVAAKDDAVPRLDLVNTALGGSFTSRLNQSLREDHGWTYGARTRFNLQRGTGLFVARAAIRTDALSPALTETLKEIGGMAQGGLTDEEIAKVKQQADQDAVSSYATLRSIALGLATNAGLGLPIDADRKALASQAGADKASLAALAKDKLALDQAVLVFVGPKEAVETALRDNKLPAPEVRDEDGNKK